MPKSKPSTHRVALTTASLLGAVLWAGGAKAASFTWTGGSLTSSNWSDAGIVGFVVGNWGLLAASAPGSTDSVTFAGSTRLTPNNDLAANTLINGVSFASGAGAFTLGGNAIDLGGNVTNSSANLQTINMGLRLTGTRTFDTASGSMTVGGVISETGGAQGLTKVSGNTLTLSGANTYTGATTVNAGILKAGVVSVANVSGAFGNNSAVTLANTAGVTLDITGFNTQIGSLAGGGATGGNVTLGAATLTTGGDNTSTSYGGVIGGTGGLTKIGTGTQTLTGANTYTGMTTVSQGQLTLGTGGSLRSNDVTIASSATLNLSGSGSNQFQNTVPTGALTINGTLAATTNQAHTLYYSTLAMNNGTLANTFGPNTSGFGAFFVGANRTLTATGTNTISGTGVIGIVSGAVLTLSPTGGGDAINVTGTIGQGASGTAGGLAKSGAGTVTLSGANTYTGATTITNGTLTVSGSVSGTAIAFTGATAAAQLNATSTNSLTGTTSLNINNANATAVLSAANNYTGATALNTGILQLQNAGSMASSALTMSGGVSTLQLRSDANTTFATSGNIAGFANGGTYTIDANQLTGAGSNKTLTLGNFQINSGQSATLNFTGGNGYRLALGNFTGAGAYNLTLNPNSVNVDVGTVTLSTATGQGLTLGGTLATGTNTIGAISDSSTGTWSVTKNTASTWAMGGTNTQMSTGAISAGTLNLTGSWSGSGAITVSGTANFNAINTNAMTGSTALTVNGASATAVLSAANNYTGATNLGAGTLQLQNGGAMAGSAFAMTGGTLQLRADGNTTFGASSVSIGAFSGTYTIDVNQLTGAGSNNTLGFASSTVVQNVTALNVTGGNGYTLSLGDVTYGVSNPNFNPTTANLAITSLTHTGGTAQSITLGGTATGNTLGAITENAGTQTLTKQGASTWTLTGANDYTGVTTISAGILQIGAGGATGTLGSGGVTDNATLIFNRNNAYTVSNVIGGSGVINQIGTGTTTLTGANAYAGLTTISAGVLNIQHATALGTVAAGTSVTSGAALQVQGTIAVGAEALTLNGTGISNDGALRNISGTNSMAGAITLGSAVRINSDANTLTLSGNIGGAGQNLTVGGAGNTTLSGIIGTTTGTLTKDGAGTAILSGNNTYTGLTTVTTGTLQVNVNNALGTNAVGTTVASGATLKLNAVTYSTAEAVTINGTGVGGTAGALANTGTSSFAGQITAATNATINAGGGNLTLSGGLVKNGTTLTLTGGGSITVQTVGISGALANSDLIVDGTTANLNVANTYNGPTFIRNGGIINANVVDALPTSPARTVLTMDSVGSGSSQLNLGAAQSIASLTGATTSTVNLNANTLTIGTASGSTTFAGVISGGGQLTKDGASTQVLTKANLYTGATNINGGTLALDLSANSQVIKSGNTVNMGGGTLDFSASSANLQTFGTTTVVSGTNFITNSGGSGFAGTSVVDLGTLSLTSGTLDIAGLRVGSKTVNNATPLNNTWIKASGLAASLNYINAAITTNNGRDLVATDSASNLIIADTSDYQRGATAYSNHASSIVKFVAPPDGQYGAGNNGGATITLHTGTQVTPGTTEWGAILNAYGSGTTTVDIGANILRLGANGGITSAAGSDTTLGVSVNSGTLTAGGAANTAGSITVAGANNTLINAKVRDNGSGKVSMVLSGPGTLTMAGDSDYTGSTAINGGTLLMNGTHNATNGTYTVGASGKLGGTGTITTTGAMAVDGQINGGDFGTVGTLSIAGAGSRVLTGTYLFDVDYGAAASGDETGDLISITGATSVAIAGGKFQLNAVGGATPAAGAHYRIKLFESNVAVNGAPAGQSNYAGTVLGLASYQSIVTWDGGKSYYLVPEPASFALLGLGCLLLLRRPSSRSSRRRGVRA